MALCSVPNNTSCASIFETLDSAKLCASSKEKYKLIIVWRQIFRLSVLHLGALYGLYLFVFVCSWKTHFWGYFSAFMAAQGITAGAHRLWTHRSYKAKVTLQILLMLMQSMAFQTHIFEWVRNHRVHHKFTDTDADPHNAKRGFFFSHIGWLMVRKHPDVINKGKTVDVSDIETDPIIQFQKKYFTILAITTSWIIPSFIPWYFWNENAWTSFFTSGMFKHCAALHITFLVNSLAHKYGTKPYDKTIAPVENSIIAYMTFGEGWHNYHHVFPWDYKTGEFNSYRKNLTTLVIDSFAKIGWAYDLKTTSQDMIDKRATRTGDGSKKLSASKSLLLESYDDNKDLVWGWGDKDMKLEDIKDVKIYNKIKET